MSELIETQSAKGAFRLQLLATVSALSLLVVTGAAEASDADADRPTVWVELGGQLEAIGKTEDRFTAPFLAEGVGKAPFLPRSPLDAEKPPRNAFGGEGKISFEPAGSDWVFSAAVRYGRSNGKKEINQQTVTPHLFSIPSFGFSELLSSVARFSQAEASYRESHLILDFQAGKDVGLGLFGRDSTSVVGAGVRFAQFTSGGTFGVHARPDPQYYNKLVLPKYQPVAKFHAYTFAGNSSRSFSGVGPALSWNASAAVAGTRDSAEFTLDWGVNGALLFGRQKAKVHHQSTMRYNRPVLYNNQQGYLTTHYGPAHLNPHDRQSNRSVVVPNLGGMAGFSLKFPNAKMSLGYRADFFFGAVDGGIDTRKSEDLFFHGPFASISIGLGG
ncbi:MAG TPA: hypothetical protein VGM36_00340 [Rhizomicrobium sp.]|jgi:hypothetical protein